jgi:hypothetical protein
VNRAREVHVEDLLGRRVRAMNGRPVGRLEEIRAERRGDTHEVTEFLLGTGALFERLSIVRRLFRRAPRTLVARWDQIDVSDPRRPVLTCTVEELRAERGGQEASDDR